MDSKSKRLRDAAEAVANEVWRLAGELLELQIRTHLLLKACSTQLHDAISDFDAHPSPQPDSLKELEETIQPLYNPEVSTATAHAIAHRLATAISLLRERMGK